MSAESPRHVRSGGPLTVPSQPPPDRSLIDAVSGFINDVKLTSATVDPKDVIQWARFETADINEPTSEGDSDNDISPLLLVLGYGTGVQVWLIPPSGEAQEVLSWRQGTVRVLRILPTPTRGDCFTAKRPLIALCDSASPGPAFCSLSFISIRGGEQVKSIKFKNPILDVLANKRSVVVSFSERFAVFDAATLEDRMAVTTCYPCPCPLGGSAPVNPLALGDRWLAYADKKLNPSKRSSGGCEGEGQSSYTATVLHAAKSLSKGLRGLGETVAHSLAGTRAASQSPSPPHGDTLQPGVVTILDIEGFEEEDGQDAEEPCDPIVAHFIAHSEAIIALKFDASGMVLVTADRRGHDFHVFRINPHPCGPALAAVHHLYVLHRGDTTAKVQDIAISGDSRWAAVSTLRGTTHVFAMCPYGGACGVRTHTAPRVVNRLSRFHRSAGLPIHAPPGKRPGNNAPGSPVGENLSTGAWYPNPRLPPYPLPTMCAPLAQLRPTANLATHTITRTSSGRQRLSSLSEDNNAAPLLAHAAWGAGVAGAGGARGSQHALYLMAASGSLMHLVLHPRPTSGVPKEKISDDSPIELEVEQIAQWPLQRPPAAADLLAPLPPSNPLLQPLECRRCTDMCLSEEERWLAQVEIVTHAGPHRRLWMGPQFVFKTYNCTGSNSSLSEAETVDVEASAARGVARSNPVNMPGGGVRPLVPVLVDSGSASSLEQSPSDSFRRKSLLAETGRAASVCDVQLREDLAEAMKEDHGSRRAEAAVEDGGTWHGVQLAVDPAGTVVRAVPSAAPPAPDPDDYTRANSDEATFRPVVRAPASLPYELPVCPLPRTTTIPVQSLAADVSMPASASDYLAADAQLEREMDDARRELPTRYPTRLDSDISVVSVIKVSSVTDETDDKCGVVAEPLKTFLNERETKEALASMEVEMTSTVVEKNKTLEPESMKREKCVEIPSKNLEAEMTSKFKCDGVKIVREKKDLKTVKANESSESKTTKHELAEQKNETMSSKKESLEIKKDLTETKTSTKEVKSEKERTSKISIKELKPETKTPAKKVVPETTRVTKEVISETKSSTKKEPYETKMLTKQVTSEMKTSAKKELSEIKVLQKEIVPETNASVKDWPDSKVSTKNDLFEINLTSKKEVTKPKSSTEFPTLKTYSKEESSDRERSPRTEPKESKSFSAWKKNSPKLEWSIKTEPLETMLSSQKETDVSKCLRLEEVQIKTEEQAWDMLLNEPEKQVLSISPQSTASDKSDESKSKSKKNRKIKKSQDDTQNKSEDDSFVEIHTIEEKAQPSCGELVSISMPFDEIESPCTYSSKIKKSRSPKNAMDKEQSLTKLDDWSLEDIDCTIQLKTSNRKKSAASDIEMVPECDFKTKPKEAKIEKVDSIRVESSNTADIESIILKETSKDKKCKPVASSQDNRKLDKSLEVDVKDVYVIDSSKDEFPEIQITTSRGSKIRKKSPQVNKDKRNEEVELIPEKPIKSWSSIAASKSSKKPEEIDKRPESKTIKNEMEDTESDVKTINKIEKKQKSCKFQEDDEPLSLHEELMRLCKRTDIMVAQCDAPSGLNFVEEHHSLLHDLPPLELDFGLDDFRLEVMKDSLLDVNDTKLSSPICKIDIDSILSSIKESTSAFNLIDLEKVPDKKEKGFSVVENDKIMSQDVKVDDDSKSEDKEIEVMEKSSDDDNTSPALSTDSDKEDKKSSGASNVTLPSSKQSKSKKSRRKKK